MNVTKEWTRAESETISPDWAIVILLKSNVAKVRVGKYIYGLDVIMIDIMKKGILFSLMFVLSLFSFSAKAQVDSTFLSGEALKQGKKVVTLRNVGRSFAWSGAAVGLSGLVMLADGALQSANQETPGSGVEQVLGLLGIASGGALALVSLPFFLAAEGVVSNYSSVLPNNFEMLLTKGGKSGYTTLISAGLAVPNCLIVSVNPGYSFSQHMFAGGGVDYITDFKGSRTARIFANGRWTVSKSGASPFVDFALGYDLTQKGLLACPEFGIRIKTGDKFALSLGTRSDYYFNEGLMSLSLLLGVAF